MKGSQSSILHVKMTASRVLVYGGKGALGSAVVDFFKSKSWWVASIDLFTNETADVNIVVTKLDSWAEQEQEVNTKVEESLQGEKLDAILCVAGGWAGGSAKSKDLVKNSDLMCKQSIWTSVISAGIASRHLKEGGLLQLTGAKPALDGGTPGMLGYGLAKAAVIQLTKGLGMEGNNLPSQTVALAICPVTLATPMNKKGMPDADHSSWTSLSFVAELLFKWAEGKDRPATGSLVQLVTKDNQTEQILA